ncbi:MAG: septal ring lytic transglycosylase RlpA family protein [Spirosomataceae bacterium]
MSFNRKIFLPKIILVFIPFLLFAQQSPTIGHSFSGRVSYYGYKLNGRKTASGERLDSKKFTAAHRSLPFGTLLEIKNPKNGKSCVVRVNDRGPFSGKRVLDISVAAAREIGIINTGVLTLSITIVGVDEEQILFNSTDFPYLEKSPPVSIPFLPKPD